MEKLSGTIELGKSFGGACIALPERFGLGSRHNSAESSPSESTPKTINHMKGLKDKIALVTGGSRGLGRNIALALSRNGADVILTYRQQKEEGESVAAEVEQLGRKAALLRLDVADLRQFDEFSSSVRQAVESKWQRNTFDFLVNNAGIDSAAPFEKMSEENFDRLFLVHFKGVVLSDAKTPADDR